MFLQPRLPGALEVAVRTGEPPMDVGLLNVEGQRFPLRGLETTLAASQGPLLQVDGVDVF